LSHPAPPWKGRPVPTGEPGRPVSRRCVLTAAAAGAAVCLAGAAGCGRGPTVEAPTAPTTPPAPPFARTGDIPVGGGRVFPDSRVVVTQPVAGDLRAFSIMCTHDACDVDDVSGGTINCPCHGSRFAITDGSVVQGPARSALGRERIAVEGDRIFRL
jgi:Rieske Fe-S protein